MVVPRRGGRSWGGSRALARQIEEGQLRDGRGDPAAATLDRPLHLELRADALVRRRHGSQGDGLLEDRAPTVAGRLAHLAPAWREDGHRRTVDRRRDGWRQALRAEEALD